MINAIKSLWEGHWTVFKHLFRKAVTLEYPEKKREPNEAFRGKLTVNGCIGCGVCKRVCPSGAIEYQKDDEGKVRSYSFDLKKCIFCSNCAYYCPKGAIKMTKNYELATEDKNSLCLNYKGGVDD